VLWLPEQNTQVSIGADEAGGVEDPAIHQYLQPFLFTWFEAAAFAQGMKVPVGVEPQLGRAVVSMDQFLASVTQRLEVSNRLRVLQGCHGQ